MAARSLIVKRGDAVLWQTSLNEDEDVTVEEAFRRQNPEPESPEWEAVEGPASARAEKRNPTLSDVVVVVANEDFREAKQAEAEANAQAEADARALEEAEAEKAEKAAAK